MRFIYPIGGAFLIALPVIFFLVLLLGLFATEDLLLRLFRNLEFESEVQLGGVHVAHMAEGEVHFFQELFRPDM